MAKRPYSRLEHLKQLLRIELASESPGLTYIEDLNESIEREKILRDKMMLHGVADFEMVQS